MVTVRQKLRIIICVLAFLLTHTGCALNSFQARIVPKLIQPPPQEKATECPEAQFFNSLRSAPSPNDEPFGIQESSDLVFILIHGIYGGKDTFGSLPHLLASRYKSASVYSMTYWSSQFLPNFQRITDFGTDFQIMLQDIFTLETNKDIIIIAHSQGGLIARDALVKLSLNGRGDILERVKLIMVGTPNFGALYAKYNNLLVNSLFAPFTYLFSLIGIPFWDNPSFKAFVYNRQAFDMNPLEEKTLFFETFDKVVQPYVGQLAMQWGDSFLSYPTEPVPKIYAIAGVKNILGDYDLSDGIVHTTNLLFAGVPSNRVAYVPYKHFGEAGKCRQCLPPDIPGHYEVRKGHGARW